MITQEEWMGVDAAFLDEADWLTLSPPYSLYQRWGVHLSRQTLD